jgi:predicted RND superfamily exporter protein
MMLIKKLYKKKMKTTMFVVRYRWWIIIITLSLAVLSIIPIFRININADFESYFPADMKSKVSNNKITTIFGNEEPIIIILSSGDVINQKTLQRVEALSNAFERMEGISSVFSLARAKNILSEEGTMIINPAIPKIPKDSQGLEKLRQELMLNNLAYKLVVSEDFRHTLIILNSDKTLDDKTLLNAINKILEDYPGSEEVNITGQAFLRNDANRRISRDLFILLPLGLLIMFIILWLSFKELRGVYLPLSVVVFSTLFCLGLLSVFNWDLSLIGILIPIMMIAVANNYGVYFVARYQDLNATNKGMNVKKIVQICVNYLFTPVMLCGLTTIAGILGLVAHLLVPARQVGIVTAFGIAYALLLSLLFVPALMSLLKNGKPHHDLSSNASGFFSKGISKISKYLVQKPWKVIFGFIVTFCIIVSGLVFFKVAPDSNSVMPEKHPYNRAIKILDNSFGGSKMATIMIKGNARTTQNMETAEAIETNLKQLPNVGNVMGLPTILRKMSCALNDSTSLAFNKIPDSDEGVSQYIELYSLSGNPQDVEQFVDFEFKNMLLTVQFRAKNLKEMDDVARCIVKTAKENNAEIEIGGYNMIEKEMSESILKGQIYSLLFAFIAILVLLSLIFRSFVAGIIGSIPLIFAVFCTLGLMGWLEIELNIVTALLSSISIGLGVDFTIHIFWRIKWELALGRNYAQSISTTLKTIGRGIIINAFSVMTGFLVLFVSGFPLIRSFALLIIISLLFCLVSALILIPAICIVVKPGFLTKQNSR